MCKNGEKSGWAHSGYIRILSHFSVVRVGRLWDGSNGSQEKLRTGAIHDNGYVLLPGVANLRAAEIDTEGLEDALPVRFLQSKMLQQPRVDAGVARIVDGNTVGNFMVEGGEDLLFDLVTAALS